MLQLLRERLRQSLKGHARPGDRHVAATTSALAIWWLTCLNGLPDIGDPFDVDAIHGFTIPDDENALVFLRRAPGKAHPSARIATKRDCQRFDDRLVSGRSELRSVGGGESPVAPNCFSREPIDPMNLASLRPALAELPNADSRQRDVDRGSLAKWKADSGDMADCYRAVLAHDDPYSTSRGTELAVRREWGARRSAATTRDLGCRSEERRSHSFAALDEAVMSRPQPEWDAFSLQLEYLELNRRLGRTVSWTMCRPRNWSIASPASRSPTTWRSVSTRDSVSSSEPERSQRALRLVFANWLHISRSPS